MITAIINVSDKHHNYSAQQNVTMAWSVSVGHEIVRVADCIGPPDQGYPTLTVCGFL